MRTATARNPMIAIQNAHALGPSCSNRLMVAYQRTLTCLVEELHCCQDEDEDEVQVIGCCHDQDDGCQSA